MLISRIAIKAPIAGASLSMTMIRAPMRRPSDQIDPRLDAISAAIADFTIGFVTITNNGREQDAFPAGSGTLVSVGSVYGILTAAHVLRELPDYGKVGLVRFASAPSVTQKLTIDMSHAVKLSIAGDVDGPKGPDIGFLRLALHDVGVLNATNVFFNLGKRRDSVLAIDDQIPSSHFDGISGVIAEWTTDLSPEGKFARVKYFRALYGVGLVVRKYESNGYDLFDFEVTYDEGSNSPLSYEGMSGGALWRVYAAEDGNGQLSASDKRVFGVAFHQSELTDQKRIITCHGPKSVYRFLIDAVLKKWPAETHI